MKLRIIALFSRRLDSDLIDEKRIIQATREMKGLCLGLLATLFATSPIWASSPASDSAADSAYNTGWTNGSSGGTGWGGAWQLSTGASGTASFSTGSSTTNGSGDPNQDGDIDTNGRSWEMTASGGGQANALRPFFSSLNVGQSVILSMDNGFIDSGANNNVGFSLFTQPGRGGEFPELTFSFTGGQTDYMITDATGTHDTGVGFTSEGLHIVFTLTSLTSYSMSISVLGGSTTNLTGTPDTTAPGGITGVDLFNNNAGSGTDHAAFFNGIAIVPEPSPIALFVTGILVFPMLRRRRSFAA